MCSGPQKQPQAMVAMEAPGVWGVFPVLVAPLLLAPTSGVKRALPVVKDRRMRVNMVRVCPVLVR